MHDQLTTNNQMMGQGDGLISFNSSLAEAMQNEIWLGFLQNTLTVAQWMRAWNALHLDEQKP